MWGENHIRIVKMELPSTLDFRVSKIEENGGAT